MVSRNTPLSFLNYGFADPDPTTRPSLRPEDEPDRPCIELYHRVAASVDLRDQRVLEISCGHGGGASYIARYLDPRSVHAVDRNPRAIARCRRRHDVPGLSFVQGNALRLDFPDGSFDAVLNIEASHCYSDVVRFLHEVRRVLQPGGHLLYADFRARHGALAELQDQISGSGFDIVAHEDITRQVLAGMGLNTPRNLDLIHRLAPARLHASLHDFSGVEGSTIYRAMQAGETAYVRYVLRKPLTAP
jgi:SAM-dependent methyltransferase